MGTPSHRNLSCTALAILILAAPIAAQTWSPIAPPAARSGHGMRFDPTRSRLLLTSQGETWSWSGTEWVRETWTGDPRGTLVYHNVLGSMVAVGGLFTVELTPSGWVTRATHPVGRSQFAAAHDAARGVTVFFGGSNLSYYSQTYYPGTWAFDGTSWQQVANTGPAVRNDPAMAFDPVRGRIVLFGGEGPGGAPGTGRYADTWEWDGTAWRQIPTPNAPSGRSAAAMDFDPTRSRVVLFGGHDSSASLADTWEYDGTTWTQRVTVTAPAGRSGHAVAFDTGAGEIVLSGGAAFGGGLPTMLDTWRLGASGWTRVGRTQAPGSRNHAAMAYDSARDAVVMFGGDGLPAGQEHWEYDGSGWRHVTPAVVPPRRYLHAMTYDSVRRRTVMFGGRAPSGASVPTDTWEYDGTAWRKNATGVAPPRLTGHRMVYDSFRGRVVLFGGEFIRESNETWEYDGKGWTLVQPTASPGARERFGMVFDSGRGVTVLFGGIPGPWTGSYNNDTWEYDGVTWRQVLTPQSPPGVYDPAMTYDSVRGRVMLHGGAPGALAEIWEYDGTTWTTVPAPLQPRPRTGSAIEFDEARNRVVLHGGLGWRETWEFTAAAAATWAPVGPACSISVAAPQLAPAAGSTPALGAVLRLETSTLPASTVATVATLGIGTDLWFGAPVPVALHAVGIPCRAWVPANLLVSMTPTPAGTASLSLRIPASPSTAGLRLYVQGILIDAGGVSALTNGGVGYLQ